MKILRFVIDKLSDIIYYAIYESRASIKLPPIKNRILLLPATTIATKIRSRDLTSFEVKSLTSEATPSVTPFFKRAYKIRDHP